MLQIAVYGKGGIGKSTISANISHSLSNKGLKVLQIGCDPKHDSTRLLLGGKVQNTVLKYLREVPKEDRKLDDVLSVGSGGVHCIEAGGPEPGVGCAGRGILTMFDFLDSNGIGDMDHDVRVYDVFGDVVCGGFAVPLRHDYADVVFIVTSGEFMSLYAANNILKGLQNYDNGNPRVGGIILNRRGMDGEEEYVRNFADGVGLPIVSVVERDPLFMQAESMGRTVSEAFPGSGPARAIDRIVERIERIRDGTVELYHPRPLDDDSMDMVAKGLPLDSACDCRYVRARNPVKDSRSLKSCAGAGAVSYTARIRGAHTIVHGPSSCAYMMCCNSDIVTVHRDLHGDGDSIWDHVTCTDLDDSASVFGGIPALEEAIRHRAEMGDSVVFVVSMCVPGIIGDDITDCCTRMSAETGMRVIPVPVDGIGAGGVVHGREMAIGKVMELVEPCDEKDMGLVNILGDYRVGREFHAHMDSSVEELLSMAGFRINTIYPGKCRLEDVYRMGRAGVAVRSMDNLVFNRNCDIICDRTGSVHMREALPRGMGAIDRWFDEVSEITGRDTSVAKAEVRSRYEAGISGLMPHTKGKRVVVVTRPSGKYRWLFELLEDLGVEVVRTRETTYNRWVMGTELSMSKEEYISGMVESDCRELEPDLVLSDSQSDLHIGYRCTAIGEPHPGLAGIMDYAERLSRMFRVPVIEGWRCA